MLPPLLPGLPLSNIFHPNIEIFSRSMSMARPSGFASAGIGVGSGARGEEDQLIA